MPKSESMLVLAASQYREISGIPSISSGGGASTSILSERNQNFKMSDAGCCSLKRKRPPKIEIPNVLREISCPSLDQGHKNDVSCSTGSGFAVFSLKGKKKFMEDTHKAFSTPDGDKAFFGVYDGHGGSKAAEFVAETLHLKIIENLQICDGNKSKEEAVIAGYLKTDEEFLKQGLSSGACCVTALIDNGKVMVVSNLGDCRAVLCQRNKAEALTSDHRPNREDERRRIEDKGGYVEFHRGAWRIQGSLAVSRSIGDAHLKEWVIAEPDSKVINLTPDLEFLVLASDGLWDYVTDQEAVDIVIQNQKQDWPLNLDSKMACRRRLKQMRLKNHNQYHNPSKENDEDGLLCVCKKLVDVAVTRGSLDDVTVMVVDLSHYRDTSSSC